MKNNLIFSVMSLLFVIICVIFVFITNDNQSSYIRVVKSNSAGETVNNITEKTDIKNITADFEASEVQEIIDTNISTQATDAKTFSEKNSETVTEKININTAALDELTTLQGIGEVIGQRIIDYRTESGSFYNIEEIMEVKGIGEKIFKNIKDKITV